MGNLIYPVLMSPLRMFILVKKYNLLNQLYTGRFFHCYMVESPIVILGMSGLFCHFYSNFDGKSC